MGLWVVYLRDLNASAASPAPSPIGKQADERAFAEWGRDCTAGWHGLSIIQVLLLHAGNGSAKVPN